MQIQSHNVYRDSLNTLEVNYKPVSLSHFEGIEINRERKESHVIGLPVVAVKKKVSKRYLAMQNTNFVKEALIELSEDSSLELRF